MPAWSPDSEKIAFSRGAPTDIFVLELASEELQRLTDGAGQDTLPVWLPDSQQLLFRTTRSGRWQIYVMNADGSEQRLVVDNAPVSDDWAFDRMSVADLD